MIYITLDKMLQKRNMKLTELAESVGITIANMSIIKNGKCLGIRLSTLSRICSVLHCQPGDIMMNVEEEEPAAANFMLNDDPAK